MRTLIVMLCVTAGLLNRAPPSAGAQELRVEVATPAAPPSPNPMPPSPMPMPPGQPGAQPGAQPAPGQPADPNAKPGEATPVQRPGKPTKKANPDELLVEPDENGVVRFNFRGQEWRDVIEWVARISGMVDEWTELPGDYVNLATPPGSYGLTPEEVRNLINKLLLARGYTLLPQDAVLGVHKTKDLDTSLVPRISLEELSTRMPYEFVKVSFKLDTMVAEEAVKELAPMKGKNGTLTALTATNRIEAVDTVATLRQIFEVLRQEQSPVTQKKLVQEIEIKHLRAAIVREKVEEFLGVEKEKAPATPEEAQMRQQQAMMRMQMQAQQAAQGGQPAGKPKDEQKATIVVNEHRNSIIVQAPPDQMATIKQAVELLDVASSQFRDMKSYMDHMKTYRLVSLDPQEVVNILNETGGLSPSARLQVDKKAKAVIAYAQPWDHEVIGKLVERLDGSARDLEVIKLRRLLADEVAGTVKMLMVGNKEKKEPRRSYWYNPWDQGNEEKEENDEFRVEADVENNRLLLRCNESELALVMGFLEKLGELPQRGSNPSKIRIVDTVPIEDQDEYLSRIQDAWKAIAPNALELPAPNPKRDDVEPKPEDKKERSPLKLDDKPETEARAKTPQDRQTRRRSEATIYTVQLTADEGGPDRDLSRITDDAPSRREREPSEGEQPIATEPAGSDSSSNDPVPPTVPATPPPVRITRGPDGRLIITSDDPRALDLFEELMSQVTPPLKEYKVFRLKYAYAGWVKGNLEDFFEEDKNDSRDRFNAFFFDQPLSTDKGSRLSKRRKLRFIHDIDTNTILVQFATEDQLKTIQDLINLYDVQEPVDTQAARVTKLIHVKYSRATKIAETIKDAYRDLLSDNDKALQQGPKEDQRQAGGGGTFIRYGGFGFGDEETTDKQPERTKVTFKGKLAIGIDEVTNSLIISTEGELLMSVIHRMITLLDESAKPINKVHVVKVSPNVNIANVQKVLAKMVGGEPSAAPPQPPGQPMPGQPGQPGQPQPGQPAEQ